MCTFIPKYKVHPLFWCSNFGQNSAPYTWVITVYISPIWFEDPHFLAGVSGGGWDLLSMTITTMTTTGRLGQKFVCFSITGPRVGLAWRLQLLAPIDMGTTVTKTNKQELVRSARIHSTKSVLVVTQMTELLCFSKKQMIRKRRGQLSAKFAISNYKCNCLFGSGFFSWSRIQICVHPLVWVRDGPDPIYLRLRHHWNQYLDAFDASFCSTKGTNYFFFRNDAMWAIIQFRLCHKWLRPHSKIWPYASGGKLNRL